MTIKQNTPAFSQTFAHFLFQNRRNRTILYGAAAAIIIQFAVFKYLYPFANYIHSDSFFYLKAATQNLTIDYYPIGYSKFLRLVSVFAKPDWVLVTVQYLLIQCSILFLLFTIFYFNKVGRVIQTVLFCLLILNPLLLHLANMVSSDGVFLALSMTWFALLLWIIYKPSNKIIFWHAIVLFAVYTIRHNALIYPLISLIAFWLSKLSLRKKLTGLAFGLLLCGWFMVLTMFQYKKLTGYWQYSPFSGWQLANNALYAYQKVDPADREPVPPRFQALDSTVRKFYDANPNLSLDEISTVYMWTPRFPLMQYPDNLFKANDTSMPKLKNWARMAPLYSSYGWHIIKKYPLHFLRYFIWPNIPKYLAPSVEFLGYYNWGQPTVPEVAMKWFGYKENQVKIRMKSGQVWVLRYYPSLVSIANLLILLLLISYLLLKGWQYSPSFNKSVLLASFTWIANAGFTIFASSPALRFQAFPALLSATFSLLLIDWLVTLIQRMKLQSHPQQPDRAYSQEVSALRI